MDGDDTMSDRKQASSQTGKYQPIEDEPKLSRETNRPTSLPELPDLKGSATGVLRAYHEDVDETAERDEDQPAEQG